MNKTAIVTGAAGGIGYATVKRLLSEGFCVAGMDIASFDYSDLGSKALYIRGDLTNEGDRQRVLDETVAHFGDIGVLVNVAGVAPGVRADLLEMTAESYDRVMGINVKGTLFMTQLIAKRMVAQKSEKLRGAIVNISSMSAYTSSVSRGEYCISKAGVSMITTLFADRLASEGIIVNEIRPGIIATGMTEAVKGKYDELIEGGLLPIARWGTPEDIANAVAVLTSGD
ncbi:MAG: 3-ketoacyl-ACP reductase, partial [Oscillospiraceae bacterium]